MQPGDTVYFVVYRQTAGGAASTGKVLADFNIVGYKDGVITSASPSIASIGSGIKWQAYKLGVTLPATGPYQFACLVEPASGTDIIQGGYITANVEQQDLDSVTALVIRPTGSLSSTSVMASNVTLNVISYRQTPIAVSVTNQAGTAVDLSSYSNWKFSVWDKTHSGSILYTDALDISGSIAGALTFTIPETAAFYSQIAAAYSSNNDSVTLYYDVIGDLGGDAAKTRTILRGQLILLRSEGAA